ncbi:MAG: EscU/YscU/HrcU family type III secretion system export apparatus switch protein [Alphaproteobacteria bacterium]
MRRENRARAQRPSFDKRTRDLDHPDDHPGDDTPATPAAVAVRHEPEPGSAPRIVAKGKGAVAEQILEIAFANGVKVREDADLVELLSAIEIDSEIPLEAFAAVAEILAYVYRANGKMQATEATP